MQSFPVELVSHFEFSLTEEAKRTDKAPCTVVTPAVDGDLDKGAQMPLMVTLVSRDGFTW